MELKRERVFRAGNAYDEAWIEGNVNRVKCKKAVTGWEVGEERGCIVQPISNNRFCIYKALPLNAGEHSGYATFDSLEEMWDHFEIVSTSGIVKLKSTKIPYNKLTKEEQNKCKRS